MSLEGQADQVAPSATAEGSKPVPSDNALRKRPMTTEQILLEYAKAPRARSGYDSDDECLVRSATPMHVRQARAAAVANLENVPPVPPVDFGAAAKYEYIVSFRGADVRSPLTVEREWMDELDRARAREAEEQMEHDEVMAREAELFGDDDAVVTIDVLDAPTGALCTFVQSVDA